MPHHSFSGGFVHRTVIPAHRIDARTRLAFNYGDRPPAIVGRAVPRGSVAAAPIRVAGTAPVRTNGSPVLTNRQFGAAPPAATPASTPPSRSAVSRPAGSEVRRTESSPPAVSEARRAESNRTAPATQGLERSRTRGESNRPGDLPSYQRNDGYRARPETYAPSGQRAVPRADYGSAAPVEIHRGVPSTPSSPAYGAPPSYGSRPSYGSTPTPSSEPRTAQPRGSYGPPPSYGARPAPSEPRGGEPRGGMARPGPASAQPPASGGPDRGGAARPEGSRPSGGAPARGGARPRGGR